MPHNTNVVDDDDAADGAGGQAQAPNAPKHVETRPFPYGIKDSVVPPPPDTQIDESSDLPLGTHPADPPMPPRGEPQPRPVRPGRSPLSDPAIPEALLDSPMQSSDIAARAKSPINLPHGLQEDFDAMIREVEEETAERPVAQAAAVGVGDSLLDDEPNEAIDSFEDMRTEVSEPSEQVKAAEKREGMDAFSEESSTVVTPEAPRYELPAAAPKRSKLLLVVLALALIAVAGFAAYHHFSKSGNALPGNGTGNAPQGNEHAQGDRLTEGDLVETPPVAAPQREAGTQSATDAGAALDAAVSEDARTQSATDAGASTLDPNEPGAGLERGASVELPEVPESIGRLPERKRVKEARKQLRLGNRLLRRRRVDSALWHYDRALTFDPQFAAAARGKLRVLLRMERKDAALAWAQYSIELEPDSTHSWVALAEVYEALNRMPDAIDAYEKALELSPRNRVAKRALKKLRR